MSKAAKIWLIVILVAGVIVGSLSQFVKVQEVGVPDESITHTNNTGELVRDTLVGQTFTATSDNLSAISVMLATYSGRAAGAPVILQLRESINAAQNLRTVQVDPKILGDNQYHRFSFAPIPDSRGKQYFFFVVSPDSQAGNAITVDINNNDLYPAGTAYLVKAKAGESITDPTLLARSGKQTVDVVFGLYYTVPWRTATIHTLQKAFHWFISTWTARRSMYWIWARGLFLALVLISLLWLILRAREEDPAQRDLKKSFIKISLLVLVVLAFLYRYWYAITLPITNDEGNYLYDAWTLQHGVLAGGDGYVKAPLVIIWVMLWQLLFGNTIITGRLSSIVIGSLSVLLCYWIGREFGGKKVGVLAAGAWALSGTSIVTNIYVHTQSVAIFFGLAGVAMTWLAVHGTTPHLTFIPVRKGPSSNAWFIFAGILLGLGVASRKSVLALGLVPLVLVLAETKSWQLKLKQLLLIGLGFALVLAIFFGVAYWVYGPQGVSEATGFNSAEDGTVTLDPSEVEQVREYSLHGMTPFFRESLPLIFLSLMGWGYAGEKLLRQLVQKFVNFEPTRRSRQLLDHVLPKLGWIPALLAYWWALSFFFNYEGSAFMFWGMREIWYILAGIMVMAVIWPRPQYEAVIFPEAAAIPQGHQPQMVAGPNTIRPQAATKTPTVVKQDVKTNIGLGITQFLLLPLWFGGLAFFYVNWIKFHANYIGEFLPPLAILAGFGLLQLGQRFQGTVFFKTDHQWWWFGRRLLAVVTFMCIIWAMFLSNFITYFYEHTGTFTQKAALEAAAWVKAHIPPEEPIFTGAALIPYLSGHHVSLDIAHPRWYAYEWIRENPKRLNTFLPSRDQMVQAYRDAHWFLLDGQTGFSFIMEYSEIEAGLNKDWQRVQGIENGSNTLTFYKRINPAQ